MRMFFLFYWENLDNKIYFSVKEWEKHYNDVIMSMMVSEITSLMSVYSTVYSGADQRKYQSSMSMAFVRGINWWPVNPLHKGPVIRKMFPFEDVIIKCKYMYISRKQFSTQRATTKLSHMKMASIQLASMSNQPAIHHREIITLNRRQSRAKTCNINIKVN